MSPNIKLPEANIAMPAPEDVGLNLDDKG